MSGAKTPNAGGDGGGAPVAAAAKPTETATKTRCGGKRCRTTTPPRTPLGPTLQMRGPGNGTRAVPCRAP
eukprot:9003893-Lingulodinium_polyedra.AAC.1